MKKILLSFILFLSLCSPVNAITKTPAKDITTTTAAFFNCLNSSDTDVQISLNAIDACLGSLVSSQWITSGTNIYNSNIGNVGIGSLSPGQKLDVQGTIRTIGFQIPTSASSGYVLTSDSSGVGTWQAAPATGITNIATSAPITGGPITSTGTIGITQSTSSIDGYLSSTDWNTFNNKQVSGNYITALTGDVTASGPGSAIATLATVNSNVGSFTNSSITVNAKGLITAASSGTGSPSAADPTGTVGLSTVNGSLSTYMRSDAAPPLSQSISPTWTGNHIFTPGSGDTLVKAGNVGMGTTVLVTPTHKLEVAQADLTQSIFVAPPNANPGVMGVRGGAPGGQIFSIGQESNTSSGGFISSDAINDAFLVTSGSGKIVFGTSSTTRASIGTSILSSVPYTQSGTGANTFTGVTTFSNATNSALFTGGNVGIGSIIPGQILDVNGSARIRSTNSLYFGDSNLVSINTDTTGINSNLIFSTSSGASGIIHEDARFNNSGNLGVGTNDPKATLHVGAGGDTPNTTSAAVYATLNGSTFIEARDSLHNISTWINAAPVNGQLDSNGALLFIGGSTTKGVDVIQNLGIGSTAPGASLDVQGSARIFSGNLGVGTASPGMELDVQGTVRASTDVKVGAQSVCQANGTNCPGSITGFANPTATVGTSAVNGSATTAMRSDGAPAINQTMIPTWTGLHTFNKSPISLVTSNNIGVGVASPVNLFDVGGAAAIGSGYGGTNTAPTDGLLVQGKVGIGSTNPTQTLEVTGSQMIINYGATAPNTIQQHALGTSASPTGLTTGTNLGVLNFRGYGATSFLVSTGQVVVVAEENFTDSSAATGIRFRTTPTGSVTSGITMYLAGSGNVGIGSAVPGAKLDVFGNQRILSTGNLSIGTSSAANKLQVLGSAAIGDATYNTASPTNGLLVKGNVGIGSLAPGQALDVQGNIRISSLGSSLTITQGSNSCAGQSALSTGTVTVSTTCTPATSKGIFITDAGGGVLANIGSLSVGTVTGSTSFVINSSNALDSSNVNWEIHGI